MHLALCPWAIHKSAQAKKFDSRLSQSGFLNAPSGANVPSGLVPGTFLKKKLYWAFLGALCKGRGCICDGTSACSSPRCAPRVVPSTLVLFWGNLRGPGEG